jgi:gliding motility-associated-like protein
MSVALKDSPSMLAFLRLGAFAIGILLLTPNTVAAWHIAGAQLRYDCLGVTPNGEFRYRIELTLFRDCSVDNDPSIPNAADYDDLIYIFIYQADTRNRQRLVEIPQPVDTPRIHPNSLEACIAIPPSICMQEGTYIREITLPPRPGGWNIAWGRCCRNQTVKNLIESRFQGINYLAFIPGEELAPCNSMSRFNKRPPLFICRGVETVIDFSASDLNGDSLVYRLTNPYRGLNVDNTGVSSGNPTVGIIGNRFFDLGAPPYQHVRFAPTYTFTEPFGPTSVCRVDERTGLLYVTPSEEGLYVLAVSVFEYRNGQLLAENKFDIQIQVISCQPKGRPPVLAHLLAENRQQGSQVVGDTLVIDFDEKPCFRFRATDPDPDSYLRFRVPDQTVEGIRYRVTGSNPAFIELCLDDLCAYAGQLLAFPMEVIDSSACPVQHRARDTAYIRVRRPAEYRPRLQVRVVGNPQRDRDTLVVRFGESICFDFDLTSTGGTVDRLSFESQFAPNVPRSSISYRADTLPSGIKGRICWVAGCEGVSDALRLTLRGYYTNVCAPQFVEQRTLFIRVIQPTQPRQQVFNLLNRSLFQVDKDTVIVPVGDPLCYTIQVKDANPWHRNQITVWLETLSGRRLNELIELVERLTPLQGNATGYETVLEADLCWKGSCDAVGQAVRLIARIDDYSVCTVEWVDFDTVWVRTYQPANQPPELSFEFEDPAHQYSGTQVEVIADTEVCVVFDFRDPNADGRLTWKIDLLDAQNQVIDLAPRIELVRNDAHQISGRACFRPNCPLLGQTLFFRFSGVDSNRCTADYILTRYLEFKIIERQTFPPVIEWFSGNRPRVDDTVVFYPKMENCIRLRLVDSLNTGYENLLTLQAQGYPIEASPPASLKPSAGTIRMESQFCWIPTCSDLGQVYPVYFVGTSDPGCAQPRQVSLRLWIRIEEVPNLPPLVQLDASKLPERLIPGNRYCVSATVTDPDTFTLLVSKAVGPMANPGYGYGSGLDVRQIGSNPDRYELCFEPNCHLSNQSLPIQFCTEDQTNCTHFLQDCADLKVLIQDCGLTMPNVFTPNGDNINDLFLPLSLEGIRTYEMSIYDRTGKLMNRLRLPDGWDGTVNGRPAVEGVYFYLLRFERESGTGPMLESERTGSFTLMR